jgi:DNA polymerase-3 subunit epsilon
VLVKPTRKLESRNISIHGLRPMDVSEGLDADDAVRQLLDFIGGRPLVGYYLEYDVAVLNKYVRGITGISLPNRQIEVSGRYYDYKFKQNPGAYIDLRLAELISDLKVPALPRHDALNDAITAGMLYLALKQRGFG